MVGLDVGLKEFLTDSDGETVENPRFWRKSAKALNRANRKKSIKFVKGKKPQSKNYHKARVRYARKHLKVSRQRKEFAKSVAYCVIQSNDLVAYEDLNVKGMVRNRKLAKSISDAGWTIFRQWLEYFGYKYGKITVAVPPHNTSQDCSKCGQKVEKSLSTRTHVCPHCGHIEDRDWNAARNILIKALRTVGHTGTYARGDLPSWAIGVNLSSNGESVNQESPVERVA
jgi:putative transposase